MELSALAATDAPPPAGWLLDPAAAEAAVERGSTPLLARRSRRRASGARAFEPSVLDLDLEGLAAALRHEHRGLKKLGGAYRADRDALAATAPSVKPKAAIAAIDRAIAWQRARARADRGRRARRAHARRGLGRSGDRRGLAERGSSSPDARARLAGDRIADRARFADVISGRRAVPDASSPRRTDAACARLRAELPDALQPAARRTRSTRPPTSCARPRHLLARAGAR